jgi:hypothetical protein
LIELDGQSTEVRIVTASSYVTSNFPSDARVSRVAKLIQLRAIASDMMNESSFVESDLSAIKQANIRPVYSQNFGTQFKMYARNLELDERVVQHFGASPDELEVSKRSQS